MEMLATVIVANLASSAAGSYFHIYKYRLENLKTELNDDLKADLKLHE